MSNNEFLLEYFKFINKDLNKITFEIDSKNRLYFPLFSSSIEHCISIYFLQEEYLTSSMYALIRPATENYLRAMWIKYCKNDIAIDTDLSSIHFPKKVEHLIEQVDLHVPDFNQCQFLHTRLSPLVPNMHDFTHGGIESIARQYAGGERITNQRDEDEIKSILKLSVLLSALSYDEIIKENICKIQLNIHKITELFTKLMI